MKKVLITCLFLNVLITHNFSQDGVHAREALFLKRIENNLYQGRYNLAGKGDFEKRFFGDSNARVEFFYMPEHEGASGLRIVRRGSSYILEVKYVSNFKELEDMFEDKLKSAWANRNAVEARRIREEKEKLYNVATRSILISNRFAEILYDSMVSFIINFEATEVADPEIVPVRTGSNPVTFRTVVKAELWSFWIQNTDGDVRKMANICREMITDVCANKFNEEKYIYELHNR